MTTSPPAMPALAELVPGERLSRDAFELRGTATAEHAAFVAARRDEPDDR